MKTEVYKLEAGEYDDYAFLNVGEYSFYYGHEYSYRVYGEEETDKHEDDLPDHPTHRWGFIAEKNGEMFYNIILNGVEEYEVCRNLLLGIGLMIKEGLIKVEWSENAGTE